MNIINIALGLLGSKAQAFERSTENPMLEQERILFEYLARNKNTEYGRKYRFSDIKSVEEYQVRVPLIGYEDIRHMVERIAKAEENILTSDKVLFFGITSGTTGKPKLIPVTKYSRDKKSLLMKLWMYYINKDHPHIFKGKILAIISPEVKNFTEAGIPYGPEDGHAYNNLPLLVRGLYVLPYEVFNIADYEARYYAILRIAMGENVTTIATLNPSTIALLCERIPKIQGAVIEDIEHGTLNRSFNIPGEIRRVVEKRLKPDPRRARELRYILRQKGELLPKYFWPNMELVECWKGGTVKLYLKELPQYLGNVLFRDFGYLSTEARSSVPMSDEGTSSVLAINTNFYEFIPREDMGKAQKRILLCDQLENGKEYVVIVTTPGGLYRYDIDDVVAVKGFFNKTPMVEFVQKRLNAVSITGEKIYESHINESVNRAADKNKVSCAFFCSSVERGSRPRYIFLIEFNHEPSHEEKRTFLKSIEEELCKENSEYKDIREQQLLGHPVMQVVRKGGFEKYRAKKIDEGRHDGQFKMPELVGDADFQKNFDIEEEISID